VGVGVRKYKTFETKEGGHLAMGGVGVVWGEKSRQRGGGGKNHLLSGRRPEL